MNLITRFTDGVASVAKSHPDDADEVTTPEGGGSFAAGESRTLAGFRRSYNATADEPISPSGFYQRLTPTLATYFCDLVERGLDEIAVPDAAGVSIDRFIRIIAIRYRYRDAERAFQSTNGTIVDGDAEKSRNNPHEKAPG
jgi:hypothetical protein